MSRTPFQPLWTYWKGCVAASPNFAYCWAMVLAQRAGRHHQRQCLELLRRVFEVLSFFPIGSLRPLPLGCCPVLTATLLHPKDSCMRDHPKELAPLSSRTVLLLHLFEMSSNCAGTCLHRGGKGHEVASAKCPRPTLVALHLVSGSRSQLCSCGFIQSLYFVELWDSSEFTWRALGSRPRSQRDGQSVHECGHGVQERGSGLFFGLVGRVHCSSGELEMTRHNDGSFFCEPMLTIVISHFKNSVNCMWTAQCTAESCKTTTILEQLQNFAPTGTITGTFKFLLSCGDIYDVHKSIHLADRFPPATL